MASDATPGGAGATARSNQALVTVGRDECLRLEQSLSREWLETDGLGGYASSTVPMAATRRYHGWLVAPAAQGARRHVLVSRFEETVLGPELWGQERSFGLSMARYPGCFAPQGHLGLEQFELAPWPTWHYRLGLAEITRELLMPRGRHAVLVRYHNHGRREGLRLRLRPLLPYREADALTHENMAFDPRPRRSGRAVSFQPYGALAPVAVSIACEPDCPAPFEADPVWYRKVEYPADIARGYDGHEDQGSPGWFEVELPVGAEVIVAVSIGEPVGDPRALWRAESARRREEVTALERDGEPLDLAQRLTLAAEHFLYRDRGRLGVIAGFPWFVEWGRDTYLSLPGLTLSRGRVEDCGEALSGALRYLDKGLLPNVFGRGVHDSAYNSADAALWYSRAVRLYENAGGSRERLDDELYPALVEIARTYLDGRSDLARIDAGGLLVVGGPEQNATWMDARTAAGPVTPRDGCPVEIEALWYQLLAMLEADSARRGDEARAREWGTRKRLAGKTFLRRLWLEDDRYLADVWHPETGADRSLRPNQVLAAALEFSPLSPGRRSDVVRWMDIELRTPFGLRTLAPQDPRYVGHYVGTQDARDSAYHQGTVWPWLLGAYVEAFLRVHPSRRRKIEELRASLDVFRAHLDAHGLNQVSEVFDADPPHAPGGTFAQAWSVAELLRAVRLLDGALS